MRKVFSILNRNLRGAEPRKVVYTRKLAFFSLVFLMLCFPVYSLPRPKHKSKKINAIVITDKSCVFCSTTLTEKYLKRIFPGIVFKAIDYKKKRSEKLIRRYKIDFLPAFILPEDIKKESSFSQISGYVKEEKGAFILGKRLSGEFMLLGRKELPSRIDIFFSLYDHNLINILKSVKEFCADKNIKLILHILDIRGNKNILLAQREEKERLLAVEEAYPNKFWSYLIKRLNNINSTLWIDDMESAGINYDKIKALIHSKKIEKMIKGSDMLAHKLGITNGIAMLINNRKIFKVYNIKKGELEKIMEIQ